MAPSPQGSLTDEIDRLVGQGNALLRPTTPAPTPPDLNAAAFPIVVDQPQILPSPSTLGTTPTPTTTTPTGSTGTTGTVGAVGGAYGGGATEPATQTTTTTDHRFLWKGDYYYQIETPGGTLDVTNEKQVKNRVAMAIAKHVLEDEKVTDYSINSISLRRVDPDRDAALLRVDPGAYWIISSTGVAADGREFSIPAVVNADGTIYVDPRLGG